MADEYTNGDQHSDREVANRNRFLNNAERRTKQALHKLETLAHCFNRTSYEYTDAEAAAILDALSAQIEEMRRTVQRKPQAKASELFSLSA